MIEPNSELIIDFELVRNNIQEIKKRLPNDCNFMAVIKSDAYGHDLKIATNAIKDVVDGFGVVRLDEALIIRENSQKPILAMQGVYSTDAYNLLKQNDIWSVIHSTLQLPLAKQYKNNLIFWIKLNTGMNRLGIKLNELNQFESFLTDQNVLMTHLACADNPSDELNKIQLRNFENSWSQATNEMKRSVLNSAGVFNFPEYSYDWVRVGIAMYGGLDLPNLKTAMKFRSQIISIQSLDTDQRIGYGGRVKTKKPSKIGIVYCGYADGFPQTAQDGTSVMVNDQLTEIIGRVSMDLISIDVSEIPNCKIGDWCELWSSNLPITDNAKKNNLISYELMTKMSNRVKRQYLNT